ncbi:hypothetical protein Vadar_023194 [Vaccinium darrowii]|uniref:Uncharacterized protein n=1 Tax=Vaccinium darrowii TaxID=229202 RepID=A0ACB7YZS6_9ERIC|nr:hypothetical protein Vadar_023194 [Vaccinium darrowii]
MHHLITEQPNKQECKERAIQRVDTVSLRSEPEPEQKLESNRPWQELGVPCYILFCYLSSFSHSKRCTEGS